MMGTEPAWSLGVRAAVGADVLLLTHKPPGPQCEQEEGVRGPVPAREVSASSQRLSGRHGLRLWGGTGVGGGIRDSHPRLKERLSPTAQV